MYRVIALVLLVAGASGRNAEAQRRDFHGEGATVYGAVLATVAQGEVRPVVIDRLMPIPRSPERAWWLPRDSVRVGLDSLLRHKAQASQPDSAGDAPSELRMLTRLMPADSAVAAAKAALGGLAVYELSRILYSADSTQAVVEINVHCGDLCGSGEMQYLTKVGTRWFVRARARTWVS